MKSLFLALATILLAAPALAEGPPETPVAMVTLKPHVTVLGDTVRLADLFDGLGEKGQTAIARAPEPGAPVELNALWLNAVAQNYQLPWRPSSRLDRVVVERASQTIDAETIRLRLKEALSEQGVRGNVSLILDNPGLRLHLPAETEASVGFIGLSYDPGSARFAAQLVIPAHGTPIVKSLVSGRAVELIDVPVLVRAVAPGEAIKDGDIGWIQVPSDRVGRNLVTDTTGLVGKSPRRPIAVEETIRISDLRDPVVVAKNSLVVIKLETARMQLTAQGRALQDGAQGDAIRVMNTKSNTVITAIVSDSGTVQVLSAAGPVATN